MTVARACSRVVFVRHGQTDLNIQGRVQGQIDIELNEVGRAQARAMGPQVAALEPTMIISSDLSRALDTASEIAKHTGLKIETDTRIRERAFGLFEGLSHDEMVEQYPEWFNEWRVSGDSLRARIESREAVGKRFAEAVMARVGREAGTYVFVSHGSAITQGITRLLGLSPASWAGMHGLDNCHWSILDQSKRSPYWQVIAHNLGVAPSD